jgi:hypothetical protein
MVQHHRTIGANTLSSENELRKGEPPVKTTISNTRKNMKLFPRLRQTAGKTEETITTEVNVSSCWFLLNRLEREGSFEWLAVLLRDMACHAEDVDTRRKAGYALFKMALCPRRKKLNVSFTGTRPRKRLHEATVDLVKTIHPDADIKF